MSVASSNLSPKSNRQGKAVQVDPLYLDEIPGAMDKMGWQTSAALMRRWFATKPAWVMQAEDRGSHHTVGASSSRIDSEIVTMKWLLGFKSVLPAFEALHTDWQTPPAIAELKRKLFRVGWAPGKTSMLGYGVQTAMKADQDCQVNYRTFGAYSDTLNDLFGALNKATFKLAVKGRATHLAGGRDVFEIDKVGIYCRDTYDFVSDWTIDNLAGLGVWSRDRCLSKFEMALYETTPLERRSSVFPGFVSVKNADFRRWQKARNEGGDFYVYSDILWLEPFTKYVALD